MPTVRPLVLAALALLALPGLAACRSEGCRAVTTDRSVIGGTAEYRPGSTKEPFTLAGTSIDSMTRSRLVLAARLASENEGERAVRIELEGLAPAPAKRLGEGPVGRACLVLQTDAPPTCLPLAGSVEVRRLDRDCFVHESGLAVCAENVEVVLHATSEERGLSLRLDLTADKAQRWTDTACESDDTLL